MKSRVNPKLRAVFFVCALNAAWILAAWMYGSREQWLWITPIALSINFLLMTYDQVLTFTRLSSEPVMGNDPWGLSKTVHQLSAELKSRRPPAVFLIPHPSAHVFSYGKTGERTRLYITEGALKLLNPRELKAVLTFQMVAVNRKYSVLNYWVAALVDLLYRLGQGLERLFALVFGYTPRIAAWFISPWIWLLHWALLSPRDYQRLDRETAALLESPEDLARSLWKMEAYAQTQPWKEPWVFAHMCMVSPLAGRGGFKVLRLQPSLKSRIKKLTGRYPL